MIVRPGPTWAAAVAAAALLAACASPPAPVQDLGSGAYRIVKRTERLSNRSDTLKAQVEEQALAFCAQQGRALAVGDARTIDPDPPEYASATVEFRCVPRTP